MGFGIRVAIPSDSNGAVSIMVDNITVPVKLSDGSDVTDFKTNGVYYLTYNNGNFTCASGGKSVDSVNFTSDKLLTGYTANGSDGKAVKGEMANNGSPMTTLNCDGSYKLSEGYYSGGTITANSLASQTQATATSDKILSGQTAYVNGNKITGNIIDRGHYADSTSCVPYNNNLFLRFIGGYYHGGIYQGDSTGQAEVAVQFKNVALALGITEDKIVAGNEICGVTGTGGGLPFQKYTFTKTLAYGTEESFKFGSNITNTIYGKHIVIDVGDGYWTNTYSDGKILSYNLRSASSSNTYGSSAYPIVLLPNEDRVQFKMSKYSNPRRYS